MSTAPLALRICVLPAILFAAFACGGSDDTSGQVPANNGGSQSAGTGGSGSGAGGSHSSGSSGSGGSAGSSAHSGSSGSGGTQSGGTSGSGGSAATAGNAGTAGSGNSAGNGGSVAGTAGNGGTGGTPACTPVSLEIDPSQTTITVTNGASNPATFTAKGTCADSTVITVPASFSFDRLDLGSITQSSGILTPTGTKGGAGIVTATYDNLTANANVTIKLVYDLGSQTLTPDQITSLQNPSDPNPSISLLYPYNETVFARGILAPELMWSGGADGDAYAIHLSETYFDATLYSSLPAAAQYLMDESLWETLTVSNEGEPVTVSVSRSSGGVGHAPVSQTWTIAQGSLRGSIYYWSVATGQLMKIGPGAATPTVVFDSGMATDLGTPTPANYNGTVPPWESGEGGKRCVACHAVSKDGSRIAAILEKKGSTASPWGTIDLTANPPGLIQVSPYDSTEIFVSLSPDGSKAVTNNQAMRMALKDASTGASIASALDSFGDATADPAFSPDGNHLAFSSNVNGSYPVEFYRADLDVIDFDPSTNSFFNRRMVAPGNNQAIAFPSFTPGSDWVVYQKGDYSRARYGSNGELHGNDDLFMVDLAQTFGEIPLDKANGTNYLEAKNLHLNYQPTVNPIAVGGYIWVVFVSPRDYGNKMQSVNDPTVENRKQLWVAAVDLFPQPGQDPSHPAFLLRGQDLQTINMSGFWSLEACHQNGQSCDEGYECCTGFCKTDANGQFVCVDPPVGGCSNIGELCGVASDCCDSTAVCIGGFCTAGKVE